MPLSLITGQFRVLGTQPDGDSVRFYPGDPRRRGRRPLVTIRSEDEVLGAVHRYSDVPIQFD